jgi:uncharacterized protein involved in cysteine biosynthesis
MEAFFVSATRAVKSLFTPGMFGLFLLTVGITVAALIGFVIITSSFSVWLAGVIQQGTLADLLPWLGSIGSVLIAWMLFPGIMPIIASFFDDRIARTIERHEYAATAAREPAFLPELLHDMRFAATAIFLNLLALPFYVFFSVLSPILFYLLNGYLLGREFFIMSAKRHMELADAEVLRKTHARLVTAAGVALAIMATIPLLNLLAPFWGIALMLHLYHWLAKTPRAALLPPR